MKHNHGVIKKYVINEKEEIMSWDKYEVGYFVSEDQCIVKTPIFFKYIRPRGVLPLFSWWGYF